MNWLGVDWTNGESHMWDNHKVTVAEATEALGDTDAVVIDPDPASKSGHSARVVGYCPSRRAILTVVIVRSPEDGRLYGANGWPSNRRDARIYEGGERR